MQWSTDAAPSSTASRTPLTVAELVAVHPHAEAGGRAGLEHASGLLGRERAALAERVDPARVRGARGEHLADDEVDVRVGGSVGVAVERRVLAELERHHVRAEERDLVGDLAGESHEALLVGDGEAVARLDLERRRALRVQLGDEAGEPGTQLVVGRGTRGRDGRADAAGLVALPGHARGELLGAVAAEHEVRVAVDEAGDDRAAADVDDLDIGVPDACGAPRPRADPRARRGARGARWRASPGRPT